MTDGVADTAARSGTDVTDTARLSVTPDDAFAALADADRRAIVSALYDADEPMTVETLADALVSCDGDQHHRALAALTRVHLPALADHGLIEYDRASGTVRCIESPLVVGLLRAEDGTD